jgi:hypothetical protein
MLVRVDPASEPKDLGVEEMGGRVLRVRHPLPACQRMQVMRPLVVIVGESVRAQDCELLIDQARAIGAAIVQLGPLVPRAAVGPWTRQAMEIMRVKRAGAAKKAA